MSLNFKEANRVTLVALEKQQSTSVPGHVRTFGTAILRVRSLGYTGRELDVARNSLVGQYLKSGVSKLTPQIGTLMAVVGAVHRIINGHNPLELGPPNAIHRIRSLTTNCFLIVPRWTYYCARAEFSCRYELLRQIGRRP